LLADLSNYRQRVADCGTKAQECEKTEDYEGAYKYYISALEIFMHLIKYEKNAALVKVYREKMD